MKSELGYNIDCYTISSIIKYKDGLKDIAPERITLEFFKLLNGDYYINALTQCLSDGVIYYIISNNINILRHNIEKLHDIDGFIEKSPHKIRKYLRLNCSGNLTNNGMIRLEQIVSGCDIRKLNLKLSNKISRRIIKADFFLNNVDRLDLYETFFSSKDMIYDLVCLSGRRDILTAAERYIRIHSNRLLSSDKIMELTNLRGKSFGRILYELNRERFYGRVTTKKQAEEFIRNL